MARLQKVPQYIAVRTLSAFTADGAISDTTYPPYNAASGSDEGDTLSVYWNATGAAELDSLDLQVLYRNTTSGTWVKGPAFYGVNPQTIITFAALGYPFIQIRVLGGSVHAGVTAGVIYAAIG
jgi:hypothetical protein